MARAQRGPSPLKLPPSPKSSLFWSVGRQQGRNGRCRAGGLREGRLEPIKAAVSGTVNAGLLEVRAEAEGGCAFGAVHAGLREELKDGRGQVSGRREEGQGIIRLRGEAFRMPQACWSQAARSRGESGRIFEWPCFGQACYLPDVGRS